MQRRIEDRIRDLCSKAIAAQGGAELEAILAKLNLTLRDHTERLRKIAGSKLVRRAEDSFPERRSA